MSKILKFTQFSLRDLFVASAPTIALIVGVCLLAYWLVDPAPPRTVRLATGQENSAYEEFGKKYAAALAKHGVKVTLVPSAGSGENLRRLRAGEVDIAFVQSGSTNEEAAEREGLTSLGSLFVEPLWLFLRETKGKPITQVSQLKGMKINFGPKGAGAPRLFRQVLSLNGLEKEDVERFSLANTPATVELLEGRIDGLVFTSAPEAPLIQMLLQTPGIKLFNFSQAEAYARKLPFLTHVVLPQGIVDLGRDIPAEDYNLIAPTATLVARDDLHPALVDLFVQAAGSIHNGAGWFQQQGQFPSAKYTEIPVDAEAAKYYKNGPPLLQRYMTFWLANFFDRMWVVVLALSALVIPLSRIIPPLYVWRIRSRVYRWYGQLRTVEQQVEGAPEASRMQVYEQQLKRLDEIEELVNQISIPLSFADGLYGLRSHIQFVRKRIQFLMGEGAPAGTLAVPV
nr:TAXI family TRAP transporter solute-binding subunit [uncultured Duganella sp.]